MAALASPLSRFAVTTTLWAAEPKRVAFGGIRIECSTYTPILTRMNEFAVKRGQALADMPFFSKLKKYPYPFRPTLLADAVPGGAVEAKTYQKLKAEFLDRVKALLPLDGLYLAMHGAMSVEGMQDADGDWIASAREVVGPNCLITASFRPARKSQPLRSSTTWTCSLPTGLPRTLTRKKRRNARATCWSIVSTRI